MIYFSVLVRVQSDEFGFALIQNLCTLDCQGCAKFWIGRHTTQFIILNADERGKREYFCLRSSASDFLWRTQNFDAHPAPACGLNIRAICARMVLIRVRGEAYA